MHRAGQAIGRNRCLILAEHPLTPPLSPEGERSALRQVATPCSTSESDFFTGSTRLQRLDRGDLKGRNAPAMFDIFSVHVVSLLLVGLAVVAVFVYIPLVSDYAFWFVVAGYVMLAGHRPPAK
jgi:hypothetical protein